MVRNFFFAFSILGLAFVLIGALFDSSVLWLLVLLVPYILLGLYDLFVSKHNVLRIYPVLGHFRYGLEFISPEIRQYFVETNQSGRPFNREHRNLVYRRAQDGDDTQPFGTQYDVTDVGYNRANHSLAPVVVSEADSRVEFGGKECKKPYNASRLNISAMSFGALSPTAVHALNAGARLGNFAHNTGEGGLSPYHLAGGGDIIWQIGTGYFGCRTKDGHFDMVQFKERSNLDAVKMIEIKLSQGAKPSHGGVLPAAKVNAEIASIRGVEIGKDCISPPAHSTFSTPEGLLEWLVQLREACGGKPVGFKLCIGRKSEFMAICKAMLKTGILPDFITVDGAEGGTGAAPVEFTDRFGMTINEGLVFVRNCLAGIELRDKIRMIGSGKTVSGFDMLIKIALGADTINAARTMLFSLGCIQAVRCNTNTCPTGVATQNAERYRAIDVEMRQHRVANFQAATVKSLLDLVGAMGLTNPDQLKPHLIFRRIANETEKRYDQIYNNLETGNLLGKDIHPDYRDDWNEADATAFWPK